MHGYQLTDIRNMKKQENMTPPKVHNKFPITDTKEMDLSYVKKNSKCLRKLSKIQVNAETQLNELRRTIHEQNKKFDKLVEIIKKEPIRNSRAGEYKEWNEKCDREN